jgi:addiction module RelE/StbE family toxin
MEIRWSPEAADDLERIIRYIQRDNLSAAVDIADTIYDGVQVLDTFPARGRAGRINGTRELVFPSLPYIIVYRLRGEIVQIVRVYHAAQDWP